MKWWPGVMLSGFAVMNANESFCQVQSTAEPWSSDQDLKQFYGEKVHPGQDWEALEEMVLPLLGQTMCC